MAKWSLRPNTSFTEVIPKDGMGISPIERLENDASSVIRVFDVDYLTRYRAAQDFLGYALIGTQSNGSHYLSRFTPMPYVQFPIGGSSPEDGAIQWSYNPGFTRIGQPFLHAVRVSRIEPFGIPDSSDPNFPNPLAQAATGIQLNPGIKMIDGLDPPAAVFKKARMTVEFESLTYDIMTDDEMVAYGAVSPTGNYPDESYLLRYVTPLSHPSAKYITLPNQFFKYVQIPPNPKPIPIESSPGKILPEYDLSYTWHQVPAEAVPSVTVNPNLLNNVCCQSQDANGNNIGSPFSYPSKNTCPSGSIVTTGCEQGQVAAIDYLLGKVNNAVFPPQLTKGTVPNSLAYNRPQYPPGRLLLVAADIKRIRSPFGIRIYDIEYRFQLVFNVGGHNYVLARSNPTINSSPIVYVEVTTDGSTHALQDTGTHIYDSGDFTMLFRPPSFGSDLT